MPDRKEKNVRMKKETISLTPGQQLTPGVRIGRWTVIRLPEEEAAKSISSRKWFCRCDCGTERLVLERALLYGGSESCGCLRKERAAESVSHDLTGQTFGNLTVLGRSERQTKNGGIRWHCSCSCGNTYDVQGTLLVTGKRTHCPDRSHERNYASVDITGQRFRVLTALYSTDERDAKGSVIWHCRCDCGNEVDVSYNTLMYSNIQSCGCKKKEHDNKLKGFLIHIDGTSLDMINSSKIPSDNTTGYRGVYFIRGKYVAKIVFQKKAYYLGTYKTADEAAHVRKEAEDVLFKQTVQFYRKWKAIADVDPEWAINNPIKLVVTKDMYNELNVKYSPSLDEVMAQEAKDGC